MQEVFKFIKATFTATIIIIIVKFIIIIKVGFMLFWVFLIKHFFNQFFIIIIIKVLKLIIN